jgi:hypothetical protein
MYILLSALAICIMPVWLLLRRYTTIWTRRPTTLIESFFCGIASWLLICEVILWFVGLILTTLDFFTSHDVNDIWTLILAGSLTIYIFDFISRTRSEMDYDDTIDFIKEMLQFRRSAQNRLSVLDLFQQRKKEKNRSSTLPQTTRDFEHAKLEVHLAQEQIVADSVDQLRAGRPTDITELWKQTPAKYAGHPFYACIQEIKIDPARKRIMLILNLQEYDEETFHDERAELRLFRQTYDFLQSIRNDLRMKPYTEFIESIYLFCRRIRRVGLEGDEVLYPFFKVGVPLNELKNYEGKYFNPRKLDTIAAVAFKKGDQV